MSDLESMITIEEARQLFENWQNSRAQVIADELGESDAHEFLFSLSELEQYLQYVRANSSVVNPGIRIYLGAYGESGGNKATVFLIPTKGTQASSENDYDLKAINRGLAGVPPRSF